MKTHAIAVCLSAIFAPCAGYGQTQTPSARLVYVLGVGTDHCPDEDTFRSEVLARLGIDPFTATAATVIEASVEHQGANFRGTIVRRDASGAVTGRRDLTQLRDCAALVSRMAVSTSIALNPVSSETPLAPPPAAPVPGPEGPVGPQGPPGPPGPSGSCQSCREAPSARSALRVRLGAGGFGSLGSAPSVTGGLTLHADLRAQDWSVGAGLRIDAPVTLDIPARASPRIAAGSTLETRSVIGELSGCLHRRWFVGCGVFGAGALLPTLQGAAGPTSAVQIAAGLRAGVEFAPWSGFALRVYGAIDVPLVPATVRVTGAASEPVVTVWRQGGVSGSLGLMALLALP